jgi:hypothetical protein
MSATETTYRPQFAVLGGFAGFVAVAAAATALVYSAGDPGNRAHWLRVAVAAVVGAGTGAYLGQTRRQFILNCAAPVVRPLAAMRRALGLDRERTRGILQFLLAGLMLAAWVWFIVLPDWRLHRLIDQLQSANPSQSWTAAAELGTWDCGGITSLAAERNRRLVDLLTHDSAEVRWLARALALDNVNLSIAAAVPGLVELLDDPDAGARDYAATTLVSGAASATRAVPLLVQLLQDPNSPGHANVAQVLSALGPAAKEAVPELARLLSDEDADCHWWAITALGEIHSSPRFRFRRCSKCSPGRIPTSVPARPRPWRNSGGKPLPRSRSLSRNCDAETMRDNRTRGWRCGYIDPGNSYPYPQSGNSRPALP